ncbi:hypothetical protein [Paracoccus yeei]|jgi:hypothetical protein|uniref:hypothetical protein n=1 Tax=Paracoccus yeei TaxID=147645 RepID=UPI003BF78C32
MAIDGALKRIAPTLGEVYQNMQDLGVDREAINEAMKCVLPLVNYCLRLDARLSALECRERARAEIREARS